MAISFIEAINHKWLVLVINLWDYIQTIKWGLVLSNYLTLVGDLEHEFCCSIYWE